VTAQHAPLLRARPEAAVAAARFARPLALLGADDVPWLGALTDTVVRFAGQPWRLALEAIETGTWMTHTAGAPAGRVDTREESPHATREVRASVAREVPARRVNAAVGALRRMLAGRAYNIALARKARSLVLGLPALTDEAREARVACAAVVLALTPRELEQVLWADLPRERPIELPTGRPDELHVAAQANVGLVQRALRRAHAIELAIRGDAGPVLRGAAARGLLITATERETTAATGREITATEREITATEHESTATEHESTATERATGVAATEREVRRFRETVLDIVGPLALCHGTTVYGRALGSLVPLLGTCDDFTLTIRAEARGQTYELSLASPALLPVGPAARPWAVVEQLARDLERLGIAVVRSPAAIASGGALVCPDLGVEVGGRVVWIEIVGFWTPEYLARKLARYRVAGAGEVVLCVDSTRACDDDDPPAGASLVRFERRIHAGALAQLLGAGTIKVG